MDKIVVQIGEGKTAQQGQTLVSYALGSCIGICLYDREKKLAGMVHAILPENPGTEKLTRGQKYRYADQGIRYLINQMCAKGAKKSHLTAKLVGGAQMFESINYDWDIGKLNIEMARRTLAAERVPVLAEDTGGNHGRTVTFFAEDGCVKVEAARYASIIL